VRTQFDIEDIEAIANQVAEILLPRLSGLLDVSREPDELLTIEEAAALLKRSPKQIYQWVFNTSHGTGNFPFQKQGKQLRFSKKALLGWRTNG
jgi:hypothetical protein